MKQMSPLVSIRKHVAMLGLTGACLVLGFGVLGAATELSGAVIASGTIVVESNVKKIQHPTGGTVKEVLVVDGQQVRAGDVLIRFDEVIARATLAAASKAYWELQVRRARLEAERDDADDLTISDEVAPVREDPAVAAMIAGERRLLQFKRDSTLNRKNQLHERIAQLEDEITGLGEQLTAKEEEYSLVQKERAAVEVLWEQKLVSIQRLVAQQREAARLYGERGLLKASIAQSRGKIAEARLQITQIGEDIRRDVSKELADIRAKSEELFEKRIAAQDIVDRLEMRSPHDGIVHSLAAHTRGGVFTPGETIMLIVPGEDRLVIETQVAPQDIHQVYLNQPAVVRLPNFNARSTPEFTGTVVRIGADASRDDKAGPRYFIVRVAVAKDALREWHVALMPGMPAEVFYRTKQRSLLSYLVKPLTEQASRAFRE